MMEIEKIGAAAALFVLIASGGIAWANLNNKIDKLSGELKTVEKKTTETACLQILSRQMATIEKGLEKPEKKLAELSVKHRCVPGTEIAIPDFSQWSNSTGSLGASVNVDNALMGQLRDIDYQILAAQRNEAAVRTNQQSPEKDN